MGHPGTRNSGLSGVFDSKAATHLADSALGSLEPDGSNSDRILRSLRRIIRAVNIYSKKLNAERHITGPQLICLRAVAKLEPIPLTRLAREISIGISTVNGIVDRLEQKRLIIRIRSNEDRREVMARITEEGRSVVKQTPLLLQDRLSEGLLQLSDLEQIAIALGLEKIVGLMEAERLDASPNLLVAESTIGAQIEGIGAQI